MKKFYGRKFLAVLLFLRIWCIITLVELTKTDVLERSERYAKEVSVSCIGIGLHAVS